MRLDEYELDLLEAVDSTTEFQRVENFEDELLEAKMAANNYLKKTKNVNIRIPELISKELNIDLDDFRHINIQKLLDNNVPWLKKIIYLEKLEDIDEVIEMVPDVIAHELKRMKELSNNIEYDNFVLAPLYYAKMLYYDELYFRMIEKNDVFARGGRYVNDEVTSVGFALYTDKIIEKLEGKK